MTHRRTMCDGRPSVWVLSCSAAIALATIAQSALDRPMAVSASGDAPSTLVDMHQSGIPAVRIDINRASRDELMLLPGIGPAMADRIFEDRVQNGRFHEIGDLDRVRGIGPRTIESIQPYLTVR